MLKSFAPFLMPFSTALNQGMPAIFTTVTIVLFAANATRPVKPDALAIAALPSALSVLRLFINVSLVDLCSRCARFLVLPIDANGKFPASETPGAWRRRSDVLWGVLVRFSPQAPPHR